MICANFGAFTTKPTIFSQICCTIIDVDYNACSGEALRSRCSESETVSLYNSGYITSPNYPDKYYMDIRTSTTFGRHESQLPGQVLHGNPDKYYIWTSRVPTTRTSTTWISGQVLHLDVASPNYPDKYYMDAECRSVVYQYMSLRTVNIISKYLLLIGRIATRSARRGLLMQTQ